MFTCGNAWKSTLHFKYVNMDVQITADKIICIAEIQSDVDFSSLFRNNGPYKSSLKIWTTETNRVVRFGFLTTIGVRLTL